MKLGTKLLLVPVGVAVVALSAGALNAGLMQRSALQANEALGADLELMRSLGDARTQLGQAHAGVYRTQAIFDSLKPEQVQAFRRDTAQQVAGIQRVVDLADDLQGGPDAELSALVSSAMTLVAGYGKQVDKALELTEVEANMGVAAMQRSEKTYNELSQALQKVLARRDAVQAEHMQAAQRRMLQTLLLLGALSLLATGVAVGVAFVMQRRVLKDVAQAVRVSSAVAEGQLTVNADSQSPDEIGSLLRSQGHMVGRLRTSMLTVRQATHNISNAASEIATGNLDLSQRTEQAASSLQQTASSMEQLTGTVRQTAESARNANELASSASQVAQRGGEAVAQVVATMEQINDSAKRIGDITGTIDGIAFQTNILALNAAVEAARAGEQGRGFAVVAAEVRSLAQRSAAAAREIKSLIGASVERVEAGTQQVADAGSTMREIVSSVQRVSDIVGQISAAAAEQSQGIGQVNGAVSDLDRMTQQNAALVEQSAAAAESLQEQARLLADVVGAFDLGTSELSPA